MHIHQSSMAFKRNLMCSAERNREDTLYEINLSPKDRCCTSPLVVEPIETEGTVAIRDRKKGK